MSRITQLIVDGIYLPYTSRDRYKCYEKKLSVQLEMISGRLVEEVRGKVQVIEYSYDYMGNDLMRRLYTVLRSGRSFPVTYLPDGSDEMATGTFLVTSITEPSFAFAKGGVGLWHNVGFTLREARPHA